MHTDIQIISFAYFFVRFLFIAVFIGLRSNSSSPLMCFSSTKLPSVC